MNPFFQIVISRDGVDGNMAGIMSVALLSLFLVFFFVTLLHCYARWFLARGDEPSPVLVVPPVVVRSTRLLILRHLLSMDGVLEMSDRAPLAKGLDPRVISSIPVFVVDEERGDCGLECVICLSLFVSGEKVRRLELCGHTFHVGCIDMWLHSHTTCPVCRAPAVCSSRNANDVVVDLTSEDRNIDVREGNAGGAMSSDETGAPDEGSRRFGIRVGGPDLEGGSSCAHNRVTQHLNI